MKELKLKIAKWIGKQLFIRDGVDYILEKREYDPDSLNDNFIDVEDTYVKFYPEKGGKDLTEVLAKLNGEQFLSLCMLLPIEFSCGILRNFEEMQDLVMYFKDDNNAEKILRAVLEVIK